MTIETKEKIILFWSGGKDCALALHEIKKADQFEIACIFTTLNVETNHVHFHGLPDKILVEQAKLLNIPLQRVYLNENPTNEEYKKEVGKFLSMFRKKGIKHVAFGDINQAEIKNFKEEFLKELDITAHFPLWGMETIDVAKKFLQTGHKAIVTSVLKEGLGENFLAREYNIDFLESLPKGIDPAGENGEFHTFCLYGPYFKTRVAFSKAIAIEEGPYIVSLIKEP